MNLLYFKIFGVALLLSIFFTFLVKKIARKFEIVDLPLEARKIHKEAVPLLGGVAIFMSFFIVVFFVKDYLLVGDLKQSHWIGFFIGSLVLVLGGFLDDKYNLKPKYQVIFPLLACLSLIYGGVSIEKIGNPFGGFLFFNHIFFSHLIIFLWLMGMMYTTKLLDGIDGLVTGVTGIGALIIFLFTMSIRYYQPDIGLAALILLGTCFGFLIFNWHPAKIFLGEGGSLFLGFTLGTLAIISGGKIAIALLVMGIPILDVGWTIIRRLIAGKNPFKFSDRKHLHHRLFDLGISQKSVVLVFYFFSLTFGLSALFLQSRGKMLVLSTLPVVMFILILSLNYFGNKKKL